VAGRPGQRGKSNDENLCHLGGGENRVAFSRVTLNVQILRTGWHGAENTISMVWFRMILEVWRLWSEREFSDFG
jgi:hypothetical protein